MRIGKVTIQQDNMRPQASNNKATPSHVIHEDEVINIQLPYDPQAPMEPELWSELFHPISLHGSIEHFASDTKNIKVLLNFLAKYIQENRLTATKSMISTTSIAWEMQSGISSHQSTCPNGMCYLLTKNRILSELRSL